MDKIKIENIKNILTEHTVEHDDYGYLRKTFVSREEKKQCIVAVYEIPPLKSAFPYHSHTNNEEVFFIISGSGTLRTPDGEKNISEGDLIFFPANENGTHKLTNNSETQNLIYIDFDTRNDMDVCFYPDSKKIGVWGMGVNKVFMSNSNVDYYEGE